MSGVTFIVIVAVLKVLLDFFAALGRRRDAHVDKADDAEEALHWKAEYSGRKRHELPIQTGNLPSEQYSFAAGSKGITDGDDDWSSPANPTSDWTAADDW